MEYYCRKTGGWMLIGECSEEVIEDEGFCPILVVALVKKYPQGEGVKIHQPPRGSLEEKQYEPDSV